MGVKKLPKVKELQTEYAKLLEEKKKTYACLLYTSRLKLMKADHQSKQYRLEDQLLKYFPEEIEKHKGFIKPTA